MYRSGDKYYSNCRDKHSRQDVGEHHRQYVRPRDKRHSPERRKNHSDVDRKRREHDFKRREEEDYKGDRRSENTGSSRKEKRNLSPLPTSRTEFAGSTNPDAAKKFKKKQDTRREKISEWDEPDIKVNTGRVDFSWGKSFENERHSEKEKPNFEVTGKLAEDTNKFRGVVIKYSEPAEARKPKRRWRLYPFKCDKELPVLYIHRQSGYLLGRDRKIADIPLDHPSCSKQHAVLQYRIMPFKKEDGSTVQQIKPYLMDLESANGTFLNNKKIEARRYYELIEKDVIKFGYSSREYVLLHEHSQESGEDDNVADMLL